MFSSVRADHGIRLERAVHATHAITHTHLRRGPLEGFEHLRGIELEIRPLHPGVHPSGHPLGGLFWGQLRLPVPPHRLEDPPRVEVAHRLLLVQPGRVVPPLFVKKAGLVLQQILHLLVGAVAAPLDHLRPNVPQMRLQGGLGVPDLAHLAGEDVLALVRVGHPPPDEQRVRVVGSDGDQALARVGAEREGHDGPHREGVIQPLQLPAAPRLPDAHVRHLREK
eukprot:1178435-Prorocentrum_minimum.AAC.1